MSTIKVGINGFGRIGRLVFRAMAERSNIEVVGINDLIDAEYMAYMLKYDSVHGAFNGEVSVEGNNLVVNGKTIRITAERDPNNLKWNEIGAEYIVESTGLFLSADTANAHINAGAKKVVLSAPSKDDTPMFVMGVNHKELTDDIKILSNASCTTNCLAPMAKALNDKFGIVEGLMTTIHAYTGDQMTLDGPHPKGDFRRARAAAANIVPNSTGAAKAIGLVIPELNGKLDGAAQRVPVPTGSLTELVSVLSTKVTVDEVNAAMKEASTESFGYTEEQLVSSDIVGITYGSLFDATQTKVMTVGDQQLVKTVSWYDNETGYSNKVLDLIAHISK